MSLLYKYVSAERIRDCLPDQTRWDPAWQLQPSALNDPFECAVRGPILTEYDKNVSRKPYCHQRCQSSK